MLKFLLKRGYIAIVPFEETFFLSTGIPSHVSMTKQLIELNYASSVPFKPRCMIDYQEGQVLYLWFCHQEYKERLRIPESFLIYYYYKARYQEAILVIGEEKRKIVVIKESRLKATMTVETSVYPIEQTLALLQEEYMITSVVSIGTKEYHRAKTDALHTIPIKEWIRFSNISIDKATVLRFFEERLLYPVIGLIILYMITTYTQARWMEHKEHILEKELRQLQIKNSAIKEQLRSYNAEIEKFNQFEEKELSTPNPYRIVERLCYSIGNKERAIIDNLQIEGLSMELRLKTSEGAVKYLNRLNQTGLFKNVTIQNIYKGTNKDDLVVYDIELKTPKEMTNAK